MRLGFYQPDIPQNLGAALRLGACLRTPVDIVEPCGFPLTDRALRRAAMDYGDLAEVRRHPGWRDYMTERRSAGSRIVLFTTAGEIPLESFEFRADDSLLFGRESAGAPAEVHQAADACVCIAMTPGARSLNVAMAAGIALWQALRSTNLLPERGS